MPHDLTPEGSRAREWRVRAEDIAWEIAEKHAYNLAERISGDGSHRLDELIGIVAVQLVSEVLAHRCSLEAGDSREEFEKWVGDTMTLTRVDGGAYLADETECAWLAWQAASHRAAGLEKRVKELEAERDDYLRIVRNIADPDSSSNRTYLLRHATDVLKEWQDAKDEQRRAELANRQSSIEQR